MNARTAPVMSIVTSAIISLVTIAVAITCVKTSQKIDRVHMAHAYLCAKNPDLIETSPFCRAVLSAAIENGVQP